MTDRVGPVTFDVPEEQSRWHYLQDTQVFHPGHPLANDHNLVDVRCTYLSDLGVLDTSLGMWTAYAPTLYERQYQASRGCFLYPYYVAKIPGTYLDDVVTSVSMLRISQRTPREYRASRVHWLYLGSDFGVGTAHYWLVLGVGVRTAYLGGTWYGFIESEPSWVASMTDNDVNGFPTHPRRFYVGYIYQPWVNVQNSIYLGVKTLYLNGSYWNNVNDYNAGTVNGTDYSLPNVAHPLFDQFADFDDNTVTHNSARESHRDYPVLIVLHDVEQYPYDSDEYVFHYNDERFTYNGQGRYTYPGFGYEGLRFAL